MECRGAFFVRVISLELCNHSGSIAVVRSCWEIFPVLVNVALDVVAVSRFY